MEINSKYIIFENTRHVAVAPLEQRRTVNYEWNIIICLPVIPQDIRIGWIPAEDGSLFITTMQTLTHRLKQLLF